MNVRYTATISFAAALFLSTNVIAKKVSIYRWVDENNVVHFSQNQPIGENYSQLTTITAYQKESKKIIAEDSDKKKEEKRVAEYEEEQQRIIAQNKETYAKNCQAARLNIKMLNSFNKILFTDPDGKNRVLSDEEKQEQLDLSKKHTELYCVK